MLAAPENIKGCNLTLKNALQQLKNVLQVSNGQPGRGEAKGPDNTRKQRQQCAPEQARQRVGRGAGRAAQAARAGRQAGERPVIRCHLRVAPVVQLLSLPCAAMRADDYVAAI